MEKAEVIAGLKDLINDRESFIMEEDDIFAHDKKVLEEAINLIKENEIKKVEFNEIGCPICEEKENFIGLGSNLDHEIFECENCKAKIKVKVLKEIKEVKKG